MAKSKIVRFVEEHLSAAADAEKAPQMAAYMKTDMPFYGIQKPERVPILRKLKKHFIPESRDEYEQNVLALWQLKHREEKYMAIDYACQFPKYIEIASISLYERLVREGAWWDLVDGVAVWLVGDVLLRYRAQAKPIMEEWIENDDMWIRRTALLAHNRHKIKTDRDQLFDHCLRQAFETEFFIRKAIGWALREYSYAEPHLVREFLLINQGNLSNLSFREGSKHLIRTRIMDK